MTRRANLKLRGRDRERQRKKKANRKPETQRQRQENREKEKGTEAGCGCRGDQQTRTQEGPRRHNQRSGPERGWKEKTEMGAEWRRRGRSAGDGEVPGHQGGRRSKGMSKRKPPEWTGGTLSTALTGFRGQPGGQQGSHVPHHTHTHTHHTTKHITHHTHTHTSHHKTHHT